MMTLSGASARRAATSSGAASNITVCRASASSGALSRTILASPGRACSVAESAPREARLSLSRKRPARRFDMM